MGGVTAGMPLQICGKAAVMKMPEPGNLPDMKVQAALPPGHAELIVSYTAAELVMPFSVRKEAFLERKLQWTIPTDILRTVNACTIPAMTAWKR